MGNVTNPFGVICPTTPGARPTSAPSTNQRLPLGPAVIAFGSPSVVGRENSVICPSAFGVIRPILPPLITPFEPTVCSVNQTLPSGPTVMALGSMPGVGNGYSVI